MTHFPAIVIVPSSADPNEETERLLAPYNEDGEWFRAGDDENPPSRWDWWVIGGRWTGCLDGYDPRVDPANIETCDLCSGSGVRPDGLDLFGADWVKWANGCNGCSGTGKSVAFSFQPHSGDVQPIERLGEFLPHAVVTPDGEWHEHGEMGWFGVEVDQKESDGDWRMKVLSLRQKHAGHIAVLVDCHV